MSDYVPIPVAVAKQIATDFYKSQVVVCGWDPEHRLLHVTTYGVSADDKVYAARAGRRSRTSATTSTPRR